MDDLKSWNPTLLDGDDCGGEGPYGVFVDNGVISRVGDNGFSHPAVGKRCFRSSNVWNRLYFEANDEANFDQWVSPSGHILLIDNHNSTSTATVETSVNTNGQFGFFRAELDSNGTPPPTGNCPGTGSYEVNVVNGTISNVNESTSHAAVGETCYKFDNQWTRVYVVADEAATFAQWESPSGHLYLIDGHNGTSTTTVETSFNTNGQSPTFEAASGSGGGGGSCAGSGSTQVTVNTGTISEVNGSTSDPAVGSSCYKFGNQYTRVFITADSPSTFDHWESPSGHIGLIDGYQGTSTTTNPTSFNTNGQSPTFSAISGSGGGGGSCGGSGSYQVNVINGTISRVGDTGYSDPAVGSTCWKFSHQWTRVYITADNPGAFDHWVSPSGHINLIDGHNGTSTTTVETSFNTNGQSPTFEAVSASAASELTALSKANEIPGEFTLKQNYPNPFNPVTRIRFGLAEADRIELVVHNLLGEQVDILTDGFRVAGWYDLTFDARGLPSGSYFYTIRGSYFSETKLMTLVK